MSRINLQALLEQAPFDVSVHISLPAIEDVLRNAMLHGIINSTIITKPKNTDSGEENPEINTVHLHPPSIELILDANQEVVPIPEILVKDENGEEIQLADPEYPGDKTDWEMFLRFSLNFTLTTNNNLLNALNVDTINGTLSALAKPFFSPNRGLGFIRYDFDVIPESSAPLDLFGNGPTPLTDQIKGELIKSFYPEIIALIPTITFPLPDLEGLPITAIKLFTNFDFDLPPTLCIGLGGERGGNSDLLPLLDKNDDLAISVSRAYFDKQIAAFNEKNDAMNRIFKLGSYNFKDRRFEKIRWLKLNLIENGVQMHTKIDISTMSIWEPDALVEIKGPLSFSLESDKTKALLKADDSKLDADIDIGFGWDFLRGLANFITKGLSELYFSAEMEKNENKAERGAAEQVASQLQSGLLGNFPARREILGKDDGIIRESAVFLAEPNTIEIHETGLMINGPACGGIMRSDPAFTVTAVYRKNNTLKAFAFNDDFWMWKERVIELWKSDKLRIKGVELINRKDGTSYLRDKSDRSVDDNLLHRPFFNPNSTDLVNGNLQELLGAPEYYLYDENDLKLFLNEV